MSNSYDKFPGKGFGYIPGYEPPAGTQAAEEKRRLEEDILRKKEENDRRWREAMEREQNSRQAEEANRKRKEQQEAERKRENSRRKPPPDKEKNNAGWVAIIVIVVIAAAIGKKGKVTNEDAQNQPYIQGNSTRTIARTSHNATSLDSAYSDSEVVIDVKSYGLVDIEDGFLNFRSSPAIDEMNKITSIPKFEIVEILEVIEGTVVINDKAGNWVKIRYRGTEGYIFGAYLLDLNFDAEYGMVKSNSLTGLSLRDTPKIEANNKITSIPDMAIVKILSSSSIKEVINGKEGEWIKVDYKSIEGFVFDAYVERIN